MPPSPNTRGFLWHQHVIKGAKTEIACQCHAAIVFFRLIWGFCSQTLYPWSVLQIRGEQIKSCWWLFVIIIIFVFIWGEETSFLPTFFFLGFFFLSAWLVYIQPHLNITGLVSPETHSKRSGTWFWLPTATFTSKQVHICSSSTNRHSSPLIYLSCRFISSSRGPDCGSRTEPPG